MSTSSRRSDLPAIAASQGAPDMDPWRYDYPLLSTIIALVCLFAFAAAIIRVVITIFRNP